MKIIEFEIHNVPKIQIEALCIGKFDGIHLGHAALIRKCMEISLNGNSAVLTFNPLPFVFFGKEEKLIYTAEEKKYIIQSFNIDYLLILKFNEELVNLNGEAFLEKISKITKNIIVGEDFLFGKNQSSGVQVLLDMQKAFQYKACLLEKITNSKTKVSSSQLKQFIANGDFESYAKISTVPFHIIGTVHSGMKLAGNILGFPTANITPPHNKIMPSFGVYATLVEFEGAVFKSISNYGIKPTVEGNHIPTLETHIFDFNKELYGKQIKVTFIQKIRSEIKFESINKLQFQITQDIKTCKYFHEIYENHKI
jgi:riboflavin kinase/FMN adenylyltransferase